jgi:AcrR family transcriptional regulator
MAIRQYRLGKRAQTAEDTRRRIVEATFALHTEQGIVATTMKQIAERAGVAVGTVYHHFPAYADAINACAGHTAEKVPLPTRDVLSGHDSPEERLRALAKAWFTYYARLKGWARLYGEREAVPQLEAFIEEQQRQRTAQLVEALRPLRVAPDLQRAGAALLDTGPYLALRSAGFGLAQAIDQIVAVLVCRLLPTSTRAST